MRYEEITDRFRRFFLKESSENRFEFSQVRKDLENFNRHLSDISYLVNLKDEEIFLHLLKSNSGADLFGESLSSGSFRVLFFFAEASLDYDQRKSHNFILKSISRNSLEIFERIQAEDFEGIKEDIKNVESLMKQYVSFMNEEVLPNLAPERFDYLGFQILNPEGIREDRVLKLLSSVDFLEQVFKKKNIGKLLHDGVKEIIIRSSNKTEGERGGVANYNIRGKKITFLNNEIDGNAPGRHIKNWIFEIFLHEFGHHVYENVLHPEAKREWDSAWDDVDRHISVSYEERLGFFDLLQKNNFEIMNFSIQEALGNEELFKYGFWLYNSGIIQNPYMFKPTKTGETFLRILKDPLSHIKELNLGDPDEVDRMNAESEEKNIKDALGLLKKSAIVIPDSFQSENDRRTTLTNKKLMGSPSEYGESNNQEDFAETFVVFMTNPENLSEKARFRMKRALSLSALHGKEIMKLDEMWKKINQINQKR